MIASISVIPARSGSKSIREKNLSIVGGKPLIVRSLEAARIITPGHKPVLSSDSDEYVEIALSYFKEEIRLSDVKQNSARKILDVGPFIFHKRSSNTSTDNATIPEVLHEISGDFLTNGLSLPSAWLLLQPTSPFRSNHDIQVWFEIAKEARPSSSTISVLRVDDSHPARMYSMQDQQLNPLNLYPGFEAKRRQDLPPVFLRDGGFYLIGRNLVEAGKQFSESPNGIVREFPWTINIDSLQDLILAQAVAELGFLNETNK